MAQRHYSTLDLCEIFNVSPATVARWWRAGQIPRPRRIGRRLLRWSESDIAAIGKTAEASQPEHEAPARAK